MGIQSARETASYAFSCVEEVSAKPYASLYRSYVKGFPAMILQNGLGNALAFALAKGNKGDARSKAWAHLLDHISAYVEGPEDPVQFIKENVLAASPVNYRLLEQQSLSLLHWLRRFAEGMIAAGDSREE